MKPGIDYKICIWQKGKYQKVFVNGNQVNMKPKYTFIIYKDKKKEYRWTCLASNGRKVGDSAEGYKRKFAALKFPWSIWWMQSASHIIKIIDHTIKK